MTFEDAIKMVKLLKEQCDALENQLIRHGSTNTAIVASMISNLERLKQ
jgi:hypothetical protein